jgi:hypothetical protein
MTNIARLLKSSMVTCNYLLIRNETKRNSRSKRRMFTNSLVILNVNVAERMFVVQIAVKVAERSFVVQIAVFRCLQRNAPCIIIQTILFFLCSFTTIGRNQHAV